MRNMISVYTSRKHTITTFFQIISEIYDKPTTYVILGIEFVKSITSKFYLIKWHWSNSKLTRFGFENLAYIKIN